MLGARGDNRPCISSMTSAVRPAAARPPSACDGSAFRRTFAAPGFGQKVETLRAHADNFDLVVDLGQRIGSREWFRGLVTCGALCYAAWSLAPSIGSRCRASRRRRCPTPSSRKRARLRSRRSPTAPTPAGAWRRPTRSQPLTESPERPIIDLRATLGRGDGFARVLERAGVAAAEADQIATHDRRGACRSATSGPARSWT